METMLLFATIFVPIALVVVFVGGVSYYRICKRYGESI